MKMGLHTNTNTTPTKLNFHHKEPQCWSNNNINIKDNNKKKNKININNDNKKKHKSNNQTKEPQNNGIVTSS